MGTAVNNIIAFVGLLILAGLGYYLFVIDGSSTLSGETISVNEAELANQKFLRQMRELQSNDLSGDLFKDDRFLSLVDFTTPIEEVEVGRENPFEPAETQ